MGAHGTTVGENGPTGVMYRRHFAGVAMKNFGMVLVGMLAMLTFSAANAIDMAEGKQYTRIKNVQPPEKGKKIEVIEFFSYGCPHCNDLEPFLQDWMKKIPADVQFVRVPVMFQDRWKA